MSIVKIGNKDEIISTVNLNILLNQFGWAKQIILKFIFKKVKQWQVPILMTQMLAHQGKNSNIDEI